MPSGITTQERTFTPFLGQHQPVQEVVTLASTGAESTLYAGTVLAVVAASGKLKQLAPGASDGTQTPTHILAEDVTVPAAGDAIASAYVHAQVLDKGLVWPNGITAPQKAAAIATLRDAGIFVTASQPA